MGASATNAISALTSLKAVMTTVESGVRTGVLEIDAETKRLLTTRDDIFLAVLFDDGSRSAQNSASAARATNSNGGLASTQEPAYTALDLFIKAIDAQIAVLNNPTQTARRTHSTLL